MKKTAAAILWMLTAIFIVPATYAENDAQIHASASTGVQKDPQVVTLGTLTDKYKPVVFDHGKHMAMAGDCGMCHHQHGNNSSLPCKECHALQPSTFKSSAKGGFIACRNCHGAYDPSNPQMPGLKVAYHRQCFQCHRGMNGVGVDPKGCAAMCHAKREPKVGMKARN
jgi:Class III cytochrome C family